MFSIALVQHNNLHKTAHVKYQYAHHTEFPVTSTFLQRNIRHLITRNISPAHTVDVVPQPYTRQLAFCPKNVANAGGWGGNLTTDSTDHMFESQPTDRVFCQAEYSTVKFITVYIHLVSLNKQIKETTLTDHVFFMGKLRNAYKILTMKAEK